MSDSHSQHSTTYAEGKLGLAAFQAFLNISKKWSLNREQQRILLGGIPTSTYHLWKSNVEKAQELKLPKDTLERISYILGIYKALHILLPTQEAADNWINRDNAAHMFNNQSALSKMLAGNVVDLADVRRYLDAQRG